MKLIKWKVSDGARLLDCGSKWAESEKVVLDELLAGELGKFDVKPERSYRLEAGGLCCSSFGDEFERSRGAGYMDDHAVEPSGHLFAPPKVAGLPCAHPSMNRDVWIDGNKYPGCDDCDFVAPYPVYLGVHPDRDREREDRVLEEALKAVGQTIVRKVVQDALEKVVGAVPVQGKLCADPAHHRVVAHHRADYSYTQYYCRLCDASHIISDAEHTLSRVPIDDWEIRRRLSRIP